MPHYLIADARERAVTPFLTTLLSNRLVAGKQVNTGDYLICETGNGGPRICACIERKSLTDFAASFKDGRHANVQKMRDLRDKTGCQLYFIIEGPAFPSPSRRFGHIPYGNILSAITNLMVRDSVMIIQTENEAHTAKRLSDLITAFDVNVLKQKNTVTLKENIQNPHPHPLLSENPAQPSVVQSSVATTSGGLSDSSRDTSATAGQGDHAPVSLLTTYDAIENLDQQSIPECLTVPIRQSDEDIIVTIWSKLKGISANVGKMISGEFSIADLATGKISIERIKNLRTSTGRTLHKYALLSLQGVLRGDNDAAIRMLSGMRGISVPMAKIIVTDLANLPNQAANLPALAKLSLAEYVDVCAAIEIPFGTKKVKFGTIRAARIHHLLNFKENVAGK